MSYQTYLPAISLIGGIVGIWAFLSPWILGLTGMDLIDSSYEDFQKYLPMVALILCVAVMCLSAFSIVLGTPWFMSFLVLFLGMAVLLATSFFTMWVPAEAKMAQDMGIWISYLAGALIMLGSIVQYMTAMKRVRNL